MALTGGTILVKSDPKAIDAADCGGDASQPMSAPARVKGAASSDRGIIERDAFRDVMRHQTSAVAIVATSANGRRAGLTATSVCSLSDDPPTLLVCINRNAAAHDLICLSNRFSVNLLAKDQQAIAEIFSGSSGPRGEARFKDDDWSKGATGTPLLNNALAVLDCDLIDCQEFATHSIFIGTVRAASARDSAEPLLYFRASYGGVE